jgi:MYXO-CTERM domain-containing protein
VGVVDVVVSNGTGLSTTLANAFTYTENMTVAPTVSVITPNAGPTAGGTRVSVLGNNFADGATVEIGGNMATAVTVVNASTILATTPAGTAGAADVTVTNPDGESGTLADGFTYGGGSSALSVLRVIPSEGDDDGGERVLVIGANFAAGVQVTFGGVPATGIQVVDTNQLSVMTPAHAEGLVDVVATNTDGQTATLTGGFLYKSGGTGCSCDVGGRGSTSGWGWLILLMLALMVRKIYSSSSTSSVFQYEASTNPRNGSHSR